MRKLLLPMVALCFVYPIGAWVFWDLSVAPGIFCLLSGVGTLGVWFYTRKEA